MKHKHTSKLVLAVAFLLFSCSIVERDNPYDKGGINYGGAGSKIIYGPSVEYGDETYETVVIGKQTWMARNLNYVSGSNNCYKYDQANCATYGRLYNWATAMALISSCNTSRCASQISEKHRGICPSGWHIPNNAEWTTLIDYVGTSSAGTKLKASSGWEHYGYGTDDYGFAALPGGYGTAASSFSNVGTDGYWWSADENYSSDAYGWYMYYSGERVNQSDGDKSRLYSVRCVKD